METKASNPETQSLHIVIRQRNFLKCKDLVDQGMDVNGLDENGVSPLLIACETGKFEIAKYLIDHGSNVNFKKANGTTPLHIAAASGRLLILDLLLRSGASLEALASGSTSCLFVACAGGHSAIVKNLCLAGAEVDIRNHRGWTPLHAACQSGNPSAIEILLQYGTDVEATTTGTCSTPLHIANMNGNLEAAQLLIDLGGASMDARQTDNFTPLMLAANGGFLKIVQMLLKKGADPEAAGAHLRTAVHVAALGGHALVVKELLHFGASKNCKTDNGSTPLFLAANGGHEEVVDILLSKKASVYDTNSSKPSPVAIAAQKGNISTMKLFISYLGMEHIEKKEPQPLLNLAAISNHLQMMEFLVQSGINISACSSDKNYTALHEASLAGHLAIVQYLLKQNIIIDSKTQTGETSLHLAVKSGHLEISQSLIEHGANANECRNTGHAAIHFAAAKGDIPLARLLLDHGAEVECCATETGTPLYHASERGQLYMIKFLLKKGAFVDALSTEKKRTALHVASASGQSPVIEALLASGADIDMKDAFNQTAEDVIGAKKQLTVVEKKCIQSIFKKHRNNRIAELEKTTAATETDEKNEEQDFVKVKKRGSSSTKSFNRNQQPLKQEELGAGNSSLTQPSDDSKALPFAKQMSINEAKTEILELGKDTVFHEGLLSPRKSSVDNHSKFARAYKSNRTMSLGQTPRKSSSSSSLGWVRLARHPGSARSDYKHSATDSPKKDPSTSKDDSSGHNHGIVDGALSARELPLSSEPSNNKRSSFRKETAPTKTSSGQSSVSFSDSSDKSKLRVHNSDAARQSNRQIKLHCKRTISHGSEELELTTHRSNSLGGSGSANFSQKNKQLCSAANQGNIGVVEKLLLSGINPNMKIEAHGWTPLYAASRQGHKEIVEKLLHYGAFINETINSGATALRGAAAFGQEEVVKILIAYGAKLDACTKNGEIPLHTAARNGFMHVVGILLDVDSALINHQRKKDGSTALHLACEKQWAGAVKELLDWGADPGVCKEDGISLLYMTSITGNKSIAQMLLNSKIAFDVNIQTVEGWTALHVSCARGDLDMVRILLRAGANPHLRTNMDMTPSDVICEWVTADGGRSRRIQDLIARPPTEVSYRLLEAASKGDIVKMKDCLDDGADINVFGEEGLTPLLIATKKGHIPCVNLLVFRKARINVSSCPGIIAPIHYASISTSKQLLEFLIANGGNVNAHDESGQTPLHYACQRGSSIMVSVLFENGADIHANDKLGKTPLFMASASNNYEAVALLLANQAYPSCATADGSTPLHAAAESGGKETVQLLLRYKGDPNAKNSRKETPLSLAAKYGHTSLISFLLHFDVDVNASDKEGYSPLHLACMYGHLEAINSLLESSLIDVESHDKKGQQCHEVIGQLAGEDFDKAARENIAERLLDYKNGKQYGRPEAIKSSKKFSFSDRDIESFKCPITKQIMVDPVIASDGHTYDYLAISKWIKDKGTSPLKFEIDAWRNESRLPSDL